MHTAGAKNLTEELVGESWGLTAFQAKNALMLARDMLPFNQNWRELLLKFSSYIGDFGMIHLRQINLWHRGDALYCGEESIFIGAEVQSSSSTGFLFSEASHLLELAVLASESEMRAPNGAHLHLRQVPNSLRQWNTKGYLEFCGSGEAPQNREIALTWHVDDSKEPKWVSL